MVQGRVRSRRGIRYLYGLGLIGDTEVPQACYSRKPSVQCDLWLPGLTCRRKEQLGNVFRLPSFVTPKEACIDVLPGVALRGIHAAGGIQTGNVVLIYGLGVIGLCVAIFARSMGAEVIAVEPVPYRRDLLKNMGGVEVFPPEPDLINDSGFLRKKSRDYRDRGGADILIDTTGSQAVVNKAAQNLKRGPACFLGHVSFG